MKIVFMGTPEFAVPDLKMLIDKKYEIAGVFTQPDRPKGRGKKLSAPPVKELALEYGIPVYQYLKVKKPEPVSVLKDINPDLIVVAAFGQILSKEILDIPKMGCINVHASLLPGYRGAAPIQWTIINGEQYTGITTMYMGEGVDTGDILLQEKIEIMPDETGAELTERLSHLGASLLDETIIKLEKGEVQRVKQDESKSSYYPILDKKLGLIDWSKKSLQIKDLIRAVDPWPGAFTHLNDGILKIWRASVLNDRFNGKPGEVLSGDDKNGLLVKTGDGVLKIEELQAPNSKRMNADDYLRGKPIDNGTILK